MTATSATSVGAVYDRDESLALTVAVIDRSLVRQRKVKRT